MAAAVAVDADDVEPARAADAHDEPRPYGAHEGLPSDDGPAAAPGPLIAGARRPAITTDVVQNPQRPPLNDALRRRAASRRGTRPVRTRRGRPCQAMQVGAVGVNRPEISRGAAPDS